MGEGAIRHLERKVSLNNFYDEYLQFLINDDLEVAINFCREKGIPLVSLQIIRFFYNSSIPFDSLKNNEGLTKLFYKEDMVISLQENQNIFSKV